MCCKFSTAFRSTFEDVDDRLGGGWCDRARQLESRAMPERITILGDGAMATVCSMLLTQGGHEVVMWGAFEESIERLIQNRENERLLKGARVPDAVRLTANDGDCFNNCTMVLSAIP